METECFHLKERAFRMNPVVNQETFAPFSHGLFAGGRSFQAKQTSVGSLSQSQNTELTIITDEGDTVTLSMASATETTVGLYRSSSYQDGGAACSQTAFFESSGSRSMNIEINGDLNEEELEDIREAVKAIGGMIDDFLAGDLQEMARDGELLKELDTIASLDTAFSYERQILVGEQETVEINSTAPGNSRQSGRHGHHGRLQRLMHRIERLTDDMAEQVKDFRSRRRHLARSVEDLLGRYQNGEMDNSPDDQLGREVIQATQSVFAQKIETLDETASFNLTYTA
jgi:hypothetical protein